MVGEAMQGRSDNREVVANEPAGIWRTFAGTHSMLAVARIFVDQGSREGKTKDNSERSCAVKDAVEERNGLLTATENRYVGYTVYDYAGEKIGKVEEFFVDDNDYTEYIGVKMGSLESRSALIPIDVAQVDEQRQLVEVAASRERVKDAFTLDDGSEIAPAFEQQVRSFFGVANDGVLEVPPANWMMPFLLAYLREGACHGHELVRKVVDTGFEVSRPAVMYRVLQRMEKEGVIVSAGDGGFERELSRRRYSTTQLGEAYLEYLANALMQYGEEIDLFFRLYDKQFAGEPRLEHDELQSERKETREDAQVRY
jgi:poly-beta-hydroxybutyrate-responsive repressor